MCHRVCVPSCSRDTYCSMNYLKEKTIFCSLHALCFVLLHFGSLSFSPPSCPLLYFYKLCCLLVAVSALRRPHSFHSDLSPGEGLEAHAFSTFIPHKALSTSSLAFSPTDPSFHPPAVPEASQTGLFSVKL